MKTEIIDISPTQKELKIELEAEVVREAYHRIIQKYARAANVPGFRKGLAPADVIRLRYKNEIQSDTLQDLLKNRVAEAIREHEIHPLSDPEIHIEDSQNLKLNGSQPLTLHVHLEVMPEIPTPDYKNLKATRRVRPLVEGELEDILEQRRQQFSTLIPVEDRASASGDTVIVDLEGTFADGSEPEPIKAENLEVTLGDEKIEKSFTENLVGVREDEEKEFTVAYPAEFSSPALAGKTVNYKAKIKSVGKIEAPEIDDDWAQSLDEGYESLKDLRTKLKADLEMVAESDADARVRNDLIARLIENHEFEVPNALIESQARNLLNNFARDLANRGVDLNKVENDFVEATYQQMRMQAERDIRGAMLLEKVAELENVEIKDEEVADEIQRIAFYYKTTPEEIRKSLKEQGGEANIANSLRTRAAVEAIVNAAEVTEGEWVEEAQPQEAEAKAETKEEKPKKKAAKKGKKSV